MRCLWLEDQQLSYRSDVPRPVVPEGEALLRVRLVGVCGTDLELRRGYYPFAGVPGHEFVAEVVEAPSNEAWIGRRVVGEINAPCGDCPACLSGRRSHCGKRTVLGIVGRSGAFAEHLALPVANLHHVPESLSDDRAVFCEPLAAALRIFEQVRIGPNDKVVLLGAGRLGLLIAQTLLLTGCDLVVAVRNQRRAELVGELGSLTVTDVADLEPRGADVVVEATGSPEGFGLAARAVRPGGAIVLKSTYAGQLEIDPSALVVDEVTIVGSRCGPFAPALRLLERRLVDPLPLIEARYPLAQGVAAFDRAAGPGALKVLVTSS